MLAAAADRGCREMARAEVRYQDATQAGRQPTTPLDAYHPSPHILRCSTAALIYEDAAQNARGNPFRAATASSAIIDA